MTNRINRRGPYKVQRKRVVVTTAASDQRTHRIARILARTALDQAQREAEAAAEHAARSSAEPELVARAGETHHV